MLCFVERRSLGLPPGSPSRPPTHFSPARVPPRRHRKNAQSTHGRGDCAGVQLVTIFFGANDAARPDAGSGKQNIPLDEYSANLKKIIEHVKRATGGGAAILLITPPPVYADGRVLYQKQRMRENGANLDGVAVVPDRTNDYTQRYAQACCAVAEESSLPCVDLWTGLQAADPSNWGPAFFTDGLHFSHAGERAVARLVLQGIADKLPHLRPERMKLQFPHWADIDVAALEESFERHKAQRLQQS